MNLKALKARMARGLGKFERSLDRHATRADAVFRPGDLAVHASLVILVKDIGDQLEKNFPGWLWVVQPDERNGIINIFSYRLHDKWGFTIRTVEIQNSPSAAKRMAYRAGREVLERFGVRNPGPFRKRSLEGLKKGPGGQWYEPKDAWDRMSRQQKEKQRVREEAERLQKIVRSL